MALRIQAAIIDSPEPRRIADFWQQALAWRRTSDCADEVVLEPPTGSPEDGVVPDLLFVRSSRGKAAKNRLHFDLRPEDQQVEVERLTTLGATHVDIGQAAGDSWVVMADPDGNEFCVLRPFSSEQLAWLAQQASVSS